MIRLLLFLLVASVAFADSPIGSKTSRCIGLNFGNYQYENENWISIDNALCRVLDPALCVPLGGVCENSGDCCEGFCVDGVCTTSSTGNVCETVAADCPPPTVDVCATVVAECPGATDCPPPFCNVKCFGAIGDGTTDDTVAIQAAMDACAVAGPSGYDAEFHVDCQGGGTVYFPRTDPGYKVTATMTGCGVSLLGEGNGASVVLPTNFGTCDNAHVFRNSTIGTACDPVFELYAPTEATDQPSGLSENYGPSVRNLCVHGLVTSIGTYGTSGSTTDGIRYAFPTNGSTIDGFYADHVHVSGLRAGILEDGSYQNARIHNSLFTFDHIGLLFPNSCDNCVLADNVWDGMSFSAIEALRDLANVTILRSQFAAVPYFLHGTTNPDFEEFLANVTIDGTDEGMSYGNSFIAHDDAASAPDASVTGLRLLHMGQLVQNNTYKIAASPADYAILVGAMYGHNEIDLAGWVAGNPLADAIEPADVGQVYIDDLEGTVRVLTKAPATTTITLGAGGQFQIQLCDRLGLCVPRGIPTLVDNDATPTVESMVAAFVTNSAPTTITALDDGRIGQVLRLIFTNANTTVQDNAAVRLGGGGADFAGTQFDTLTLFYDGADWLEVGRAVN